MKLACILILPLTLVSACKQSSSNGPTTDISLLRKDWDSTLTIVRNASDSDYIQIKFYSNLQLNEITEYKFGTQYGKNLVWRPNGSIAVERYFMNGKMNGVLREYRDNGRTGFEGERVNNQYEGICNDFYESGAIRTRWTRRKGLDRGRVMYYWESGLIKEIGDNTDTGYRILHSYADNPTLAGG